MGGGETVPASVPVPAPTQTGGAEFYLGVISVCSKLRLQSSLIGMYNISNLLCKLLNGVVSVTSFGLTWSHRF